MPLLHGAGQKDNFGEIVATRLAVTRAWLCAARPSALLVCMGLSDGILLAFRVIGNSVIINIIKRQTWDAMGDGGADGGHAYRAAGASCFIAH